MYMTNIYKIFLLLILLILYDIPAYADKINIIPNKLGILDATNGSNIATIIKNSDSIIEYKSEKNINNKLWIEVTIKAWIWKKSTNSITGKESYLNIKVATENFRKLPSKEKVAIINKNTRLTIVDSKGSWVQAILTGWIPSDKTTYKPILIKSENLLNTNNTLDNKGEIKELNMNISILSKERDVAILKIKNLENDIKYYKLELENSKSSNNNTDSGDLKLISRKIDDIYRKNSTEESKYTKFIVALLTLLFISILYMVYLLLKTNNEKNKGIKNIENIISQDINITKNLNESMISRFEENKGVIKNIINKVQILQDSHFSKFSEKTTSTLNEMNNTIVKSIHESTKDQSNSLQNFSEKNISSLSLIKDDITKTLTTSTRSQVESFIDFDKNNRKSLFQINESINTSLNSLTKNQSDSFLKFRDRTSEVTQSSLKRTTDSISKRFDDFTKSVDSHMVKINDKVEERLKDGFHQTNKVFSDIKDRLQLIDQAQKKISDLSNNVISLQETLDNKGARGAFGEVQLTEIIRDMIPEKYCKFQETISNGKRPDCIIYLPEPTGKLIIDAKFPLENYKFMYDKEASKQDKIYAKSNFKRDIKKHIKDISEKYIIQGETANGAVMFIPSEAVFAEIHAHHPDLVKESQVKQVWLTSPTTLMALLTTIRAVIADDERSKQAKIIQNHLNSLSVEFGRFSVRMKNLSKHINLANDDVKQINITAGKITSKFGKIEQSELENLEPELLS